MRAMVNVAPTALGTGSPQEGFVPEGPDRERLQARTVKVLMSSQVFGGMGLVSGYIPAALLAKEITGSATLAGSWKSTLPAAART